MQGPVPKQFIELEGKPVLMHSFEAFARYDPGFEFILVLPRDQVGLWEELKEKHGFGFDYKLAHGGENRFRSVKNGLAKISSSGIVFIHDGVRPLVSVQTLQNCYDTALEKGNALPVIPVTESVRYAEGSKNRAADRSKYFLVQTPQTFKTDLIIDAYNRADREDFTDDASVLEHFGEHINLVEGNRANIKITYPEDLIVATAFLRADQKK